MNIFDMADQNSHNLKNRYSQLEERYGAQNDLNALREFVRFVKDKWTLSINMRQGMLNSFLIAGRYKNIYEVKRGVGGELRKVRPLEISEEQAVEKHLKSRYKLRITFDRTFEDGEKFKYGALNIGGLGLKRYGEYCVVIKRKQSKECSVLAFIKEDSLNYYVDGHRVDIEKLSRDIANRECIPILAVLKHENDVEKFLAGEWAPIICRDESYIEAITTDDILNNHIGSVRMSKKDYLLFYDYLYKDFISELSDAEKRYRLGDFRNMQGLLEKQGIKLEVMDENGN